MKKIILLVVAVFFNTLLIAPATNADPTQPNENANGYWDKDKMKNAIPIELEVDSKTKEGKLKPLETATVSSTALATSASDSWTSGGLPANASGKVFFKAGLYNYVCSGSLVTENDSNRAIVLTAGHCVYDFSAKFVKNWIFVPNYDLNPPSTCVNNPTRCWVATSLVVRSEFVNARKFNGTAIKHDWAFAVIRPISPNSTTLPDANGNSYPLAIDGFTAAGNNSFALGYPQASPYAGQDLIYAYGSIAVDSNFQTWGMNSNMTGGASGGPWISRFDSGNLNSGSLSSLNSYKYNADTTRMYGPRFGAKTLSTFNAAMAISSGNVTVSN